MPINLTALPRVAEIHTCLSFLPEELAATLAALDASSNSRSFGPVRLFDAVLIVPTLGEEAAMILACFYVMQGLTQAATAADFAWMAFAVVLNQAGTSRSSRSRLGSRRSCAVVPGAPACAGHPDPMPRTLVAGQVTFFIAAQAPTAALSVLEYVFHRTRHSAAPASGKQNLRR